MTQSNEATPTSVGADNTAVVKRFREDSVVIHSGKSTMTLMEMRAYVRGRMKLD